MNGAKLIDMVLWVVDMMFWWLISGCFLVTKVFWTSLLSTTGYKCLIVFILCLQFQRTISESWIKPKWQWNHQAYSAPVRMQGKIVANTESLPPVSSVPPPARLIPSVTENRSNYRQPATVLTTSGNTISENSAIVNKTPKTSGIPVKPSAGGVGGGRKTSLDVSNCDQGFMAPNARNNIQYRSLPRPAKSSTLSLTGGRPGARPVSSNMDAGLQGLKTVPAPSRLKEPGSVKSSHRASTGGCAPVNQTDREKEKAKAKAVASDSECGGGGPLKNGILTPTQSALEPPSKLLGLRQPSSLGKYSELPSPNSQRWDKPPPHSCLLNLTSALIGCGFSH